MYHTMSIDYRRLSRTISYALRHRPDAFGLSLDSDGWVSVDDLLAALRQSRAEWHNLEASDLAQMIAIADKPRHELRDGKIRARHGHSTPAKIVQEAAQPPEILYHGTSAPALENILRDGLHPMSRQYVHFAADVDMAIDVGARRKGQTVLLTIRAGDAHRAGVIFYRSSEAVWLADALPPQFIIVPEE
jgi:putative RNA 2'-phosphotransferase